MRAGNIVQSIETGKYGSVHYSTFGVSIHYYDEGTNTLHKTLGNEPSAFTPFWNVVDMPEGYEWNEDYTYIRRKK